MEMITCLLFCQGNVTPVQGLKVEEGQGSNWREEGRGRVEAEVTGSVAE
jgi:hypothetical protein